MAIIVVMLFSFKVLMLLISAEPQVPCYFVFGDSLYDTGNNNNLNTEAKCNYLPYGFDFPEGPTGRFTNGKNSADFVGEFLGFKNYTPPFATATDPEILQGVNYASGGAGIRKETGKQMGDNIAFDQQLSNHAMIISRITALQGNNTNNTQDYLNKCIYTVGFGSNDFINNYFMPDAFNSSTTYTPDQFADVLTRQYSQQLTTLYNYGARKVAIFGLGLIGCIPEEVIIYGRNLSGCADDLNHAVILFNLRSKGLVNDLNSKLNGSHFTYINVSNIQPPLGGVNFPCCNISQTTGKGMCIPNQTPCKMRALTAFWDGFHPTQTGHLWIALRSFFSVLPKDSYPYDISHLATL